MSWAITSSTHWTSSPLSQTPSYLAATGAIHEGIYTHSSCAYGPDTVFSSWFSIYIPHRNSSSAPSFPLFIITNSQIQPLLNLEHSSCSVCMEWGIHLYLLLAVQVERPRVLSRLCLPCTVLISILSVAHRQCSHLLLLLSSTALCSHRLNQRPCFFFTEKTKSTRHLLFSVVDTILWWLNLLSNSATLPTHWFSIFVFYHPRLSFSATPALRQHPSLPDQWHQHTGRLQEL